MLCWGNLDVGAAMIDRHPDTRFIIDHLGIMRPEAARRAAAMDRSAQVLDLARRRNAVIKVSVLHAVPRTLSFPGTSGHPSPGVDAWVSNAAVGYRLDSRVRSPSTTTGRRSPRETHRLSDSERAC